MEDIGTGRRESELLAIRMHQKRRAPVGNHSFEANARHGLATSIDERVQHAVWLVDNGATQEQAAATVNIKVGDLRKQWSKWQASRRANEVDILQREWEALPVYIRNRLADNCGLPPRG
jgi:hypothetical protein